MQKLGSCGADVMSESMLGWLIPSARPKDVREFR